MFKNFFKKHPRLYNTLKLLFNQRTFSLYWIIILVCFLPLFYVTLIEIHVLPITTKNIFTNFWFQLGVGTIVYLMIGIRVWINGIKTLKQDKSLSIAFNIAFTSLVTYIGSFFLHFYSPAYPSGLFYVVGQILIFIRIGNWLEDRIVFDTEKNINELSSLVPKTARIIRNKTVVIENAKNAKVNDVVIVNKGEIVPFDGIVFSNQILVTEKIWTGNTEEKVYSKGAQILSGYANIGESAQIKITKTANDSSLNELLKTLINSESKDKSNLSSFVNKIANIVFYVQMILAVLVTVAWLLFTQYGPHHQIDITKSLLTGLSILIAICPCAFGLTSPLIMTIASWKAYKRSIAIKNFRLMDKLRNINAVVFDKTGTLTENALSLTNIEFLHNDENYIDLLYSIETHSNHPIAQAIIKSIGIRKQLQLTKIKEHLGVGISAKWKKHNVFAGDINEMLKMIPNLNLNRFWQKNVLVIDENVVAGFDFTDLYKQSTLSTIVELQRQNNEVFVITGDSHLDNKSIGNALPKENIYTKCKPADKSKIISLLQNEDFYNCLYVGDGLNDVLAAKEAKAFIAINNGSDFSIVEGDAVLLNGDLSNILYLMQLLKQSEKFIKIALAWAFIYNILVAFFILLGLIPTAWAGLFMLASDLILFVITIIFKCSRVK